MADMAHTITRNPGSSFWAVIFNPGFQAQGHHLAQRGCWSSSHLVHISFDGD